MEQKQCEFGRLVPGTCLSETRYMTVQSVDFGNECVTVVDHKGQELTIHGRELIESMPSSDQFTEIVNVNRTEIVELLRGARNDVFTVEFRKKINQKELNRLLKSAMRRDGSAALSYDETDRRIEEATEMAIVGSSRTLVGWMINPDYQFGRALVRDAQVEGEDNFRLVDHRTIDSLILRRVKYVVRRK